MNHVVGAQTDACIGSPLHGVVVRGNDVDAILLSDAHTANDQKALEVLPQQQFMAHTNLYWAYQTAPRRTAGTVKTEGVEFGRTS